MNAGAPCEFVLRGLPSSAIWVDLAHGGVLVDDGKNNTRYGQTWPAPGSYIGRITKLGVVNIAGVRARDVLSA